MTYRSAIYTYLGDDNIPDVFIGRLSIDSFRSRSNNVKNNTVYERSTGFDEIG
ncbi:hypothetical protein Ct9H90mP29_05640 [bacterium]|nr:MAG: hypothetical protein Ct9H90mP29_05640 [bacterium]